MDKNDDINENINTDEDVLEEFSFKTGETDEEMELDEVEDNRKKHRLSRKRRGRRGHKAKDEVSETASRDDVTGDKKTTPEHTSGVNDEPLYEIDTTDEEEAYLDEQEEKDEKDEKGTRIKDNGKSVRPLDIVLALVIVALCYCIFSYCLGGAVNTLAGRLQVKLSSKETEEYHLTTNGQDIGDFVAVKGGFAVCSDESLNYYGKSDVGGSVNPIAMGSPRLVTHGRYQLLFDMGNKTYAVYKNSKMVSSLKSDDTIVGGAIASNGNHIILSVGDDMTNALTCFDENGTEKFRYEAEYGYMVLSCFSPNPNRFAVCIAHTDNASMINEVMVFSTKEDKVLHTFTFTDETVYSVRFTGRDKLFIVTDKNIYTNDKNDLEVLYSGDKKTVRCISVEDDSLIAVVYGDSSDETSLLALFTERGKEISTTRLKGRVIDVSATGRRVAVLFDKRIDTYDKDATLIGSSELDKTCDDCVQAGVYNFVRTADSIRRYGAYQVGGRK